ncbi:Queuine tRNA-ribosyltransferase [Dissostichus eleginoides]|uniref:Queuine tRNA-ribosyltransferase n=1 Tax=Dissostichus eleginoides TaxID=100907 RepID=A0AAD9EW79_DISEL|nr:Queuine tRNA-ribosyltransferase [Dissostichus eleginoides]
MIISERPQSLEDRQTRGSETEEGLQTEERELLSSQVLPLRTLRTLRTRGRSPRGEGRPRGPRLASTLSSWTSRTKRTLISHQEVPEALLDLILEGQAQRLEDQRASLSLLPDPGPGPLCGACCPDQRLEDQRASLSLLPDPGPGPLCGACCPDQRHIALCKRK